ncbi:TetR/AcrR family transcriptional regulator [Polymorphobacter arshaanensis]|uniref:TetR/AcrR family transcriptional regulator n=1 Tax=Glacieibacterium arshaanense TaxID=2511025 RepID=A0A4Y9EN10_9SPHN|nr:TetR/AcrR family transcriptional regulator [Polymorphobacter arshaanensis]TFU03432.1 TetR/AcrR family transcriptional regulator [Polymorphobacter arshaanensis]
MSPQHTTLRPGTRGRPTDMAKHAAIMAAAQTLFMENGYAATSMERIADAAQVSKLTVYRHFQSKDALFAEAVARKCRAMLNDLGTEATRAQEPAAMLQAAGEAFLGLILHPEALAMHQIIVSERQRSPELGALFFNNAIAFTQAQVTALVEILVERGVLAGDAAEISGDYLALLRHRPVLHQEFGIPPFEGTTRSAHIARCAGVILRAYAPVSAP